MNEPFVEDWWEANAPADLEPDEGLRLEDRLDRELLEFTEELALRSIACGLNLRPIQ